MSKKIFIDGHTIDATYGDQNGMFDRDVDRSLHWASPASYVNEATKVRPEERYNSQLWLLDRKEYPNMPQYPHLPDNRYLIFLEVMVSINWVSNSTQDLRNNHSINEPEGVELMAYYGREKKGPGFRRDYKSSPSEHKITGQSPSSSSSSMELTFPGFANHYKRGDYDESIKGWRARLVTEQMFSPPEKTNETPRKQRVPPPSRLGQTWKCK